MRSTDTKGASRATTWLRALTFLLVLVGGATIVTAHAPPARDPAPRAQARPRVAPASARPTELLRGLDPEARIVRGDEVTAPLPEGRVAELTVDRGLEAHVHALLERYEVPRAGLVAIEPRTGRVLAYVSHGAASADFAVATDAPAASVFKVITASALLDRGVEPSTRVCYGGGARALSLRDLADDPARDRQCATLTEAMGSSINSVFAKLADRHLDQRTLERYGSAFAFGEMLPFDVPTPAGTLTVPGERLERARTAAGFWHSELSPLHGALIASTIANGGVMPRATMVDRVIGADGDPLYAFTPTAYRRVLSNATAERVGRMMRRTVSSGTARSAFFDERGQPFLPGITVAGKTGTLARERPSYRGYTWWVGFAPAENPTIAVATLVVNTPEWRIKASYVAREALRYYLVTRVNRAQPARRR